MATLVTAAPVGIVQHLSPLALVRNLWRHRELIRQFTRRAVEGRYRGSVLGLLWSLINPLVLLLIYTFVFGIVFQARWPQARTDSLEEFALVLFCGITTFGIFQECVGQAPGLVIGVPNYVKKVVFPLEVLPVSTLGAALFHALISLAILVVGNLLISGVIHWTLILLPLVVLPLIFLSLGLAWLLASLGVFIRDINYAIALILQVLFYMSAIFYSPARLPEPFRTIIGLNPLTVIVEDVRRVVLWGLLPDWFALAVWLSVSMIIMLLGYAWFMKTKKAFADVI
jgi:lipopolysaccharide transport system permease protein